VDHQLDTMDENLDLKELEKKLRLLKPRDMKLVEANDVLLKPITFILFEVIQRKKFNNIKKINSEMFYFPIEEKIIKDSLSLLVELKMISVDTDGNFLHNCSSVTTKNDVPSQYVRNYHKDMAKYSIEIIDIIPPELREFQNLVVNVNKADLMKAKQLIRTFKDDFAKLMTETSHVQNRDATYTLNINFLPVIKE